MTRTSLAVALSLVVFSGASAAHAQDSRATSPVAVVSSRDLPDSSRSVLALINQLPGPVDEMRMELPGNSADGAVLMTGPAGWTLARDGSAVRLSGAPASAPFRVRIVVFNVRDASSTRIRLRLQGRTVAEPQVNITALPALQMIGPPSGMLAFPSVMSPGDTLELTVLDPARTPDDGQWLIAGVAATPVGPGKISVQLPTDYPVGVPPRITYFDAFGERLFDALSPEDTAVVPPAPEAAPRITGCARYGFLGESICVCGYFPEAARTGLRVDGQAPTILSASQHVIHLSLPATMTPGSHTVTGDPAAGFPASDSATLTALRLQGSLDSSALFRGQSTMMRLAIDGATDPMRLVVTNRTPWVVSIPGGNRQDLVTSGGAPNAVERQVNATGKGNFTINYKLDDAPCPCQTAPPVPEVSSASRQAPLVVPRRVLATITAPTPAATFAVAQAVAQANGLAVVEVVPLASAGLAMAVFEITDGVGPAAKAAALAADARVALAQPDFVYDTFAAQAADAGGPPAYGLALIGADVAQKVSRGDGVRVGVIDAGIDTGHANLARKVAEFADVTGTGWTPDAHGTLVAGVIAGESSEGARYTGVAPGVQLVGIKSCVALSSRQAAARCWSSTLARGIDVAMQKNVRVLNLSVGGPSDRLLARLVELASKKGVAVVSAVGNDGPTGQPSYPAAFDGVIGVTAVDAASHLYAQATRGSFVDLAAPGVDVVSTGPGGRTQIFSGTSAATAFASGAIALLLRQQPKLTDVELTTLLRQTARDLGPAGPDAEFGYGLIDVCRALAKVGARGVTCR